MRRVEMLKRPDVRTSLAAAIYIGLAKWLNTRDLGIGYELLSGPVGSVTAGNELDYSDSRDQSRQRAKQRLDAAAPQRAACRSTTARASSAR